MTDSVIPSASEESKPNVEVGCPRLRSLGRRRLSRDDREKRLSGDDRAKKLSGGTRPYPRWLAGVAASLTFLVLVALCVRFAADRGQGTDLYPRWYGLRELLLQGRNPYGDDVSREVAVVQTWFFGQDDLLAGAGLPPVPPDGRASTLETVFGFLYPLPGVLLIAPLALLPYGVALPLWTLIVLLLLPLAAWMMVDTNVDTNKERTQDPKPNTQSGEQRIGAAGLLAPAIALLYLPTWANLLIAQLVPAAAVLLAVALWLSTRARRPLVAGVALSGAAALKPHVAGPVALAWLAYHAWHAARPSAVAVTSRRFCLGFAAGALGLCGAAFLLLPGWPLEFWRASRLYFQVAPLMPALWLAAVAVLPRSMAPLAAGAVAVVAVAWALSGWRMRSRAEAEGVCRGLIATALIVPPAWETNAIVLLLPLAAALGRTTGRASATGFALAVSVISLLDVPLFLALGWSNGPILIMAYVALLWLWRPGRWSR